MTEFSSEEIAALFGISETELRSSPAFRAMKAYAETRPHKPFKATLKLKPNFPKVGTDMVLVVEDIDPFDQSVQSELDFHEEGSADE